MQTSVEPDDSGTSRAEWLCGAGFLLLAAGLLGLAYGDPVLAPLPRLVSIDTGAILLILASGFPAAALTTAARHRRVKLVRRYEALETPMRWRRLRSLSGRLVVRLGNIDWLGGWPLLIVFAANAVVLAALYWGWAITVPIPAAPFDEWLAGGLAASAFPVLVLERHYAALSGRVPDATALMRLLRVLLLGLLGLALACLVNWLGLAWAVPIEQAVCLLGALIAAELALRAASYAFLPLPSIETRRSPGDSMVAGLIQWRRPSFSAFSASINRQFGIDLGRSWAIGFIRRASLPVALGLVFCGWLLTGVTALDLDQRAVYEAFGHPVAVLKPGLHIHLPWPFGTLRPVEYGVVREIPIVFDTGGATDATSEQIASDAEIEGVPPTGADRLWDASHPSEASYLVASGGHDGQESFEIVNIDIRVGYRIGLGDQAAYNAVYGVEGPDAMIRVASGRMLARYFAGYTLADVLGQNRDAFIRGFQQELQARLDSLSAGIEIMGVIVEAIHPPPRAADAYQQVQAAKIQSITAIAAARGDATRKMKQAEIDATTARDQALAAAAERLNQAKVDAALFEGDVEAFRKGGDAFLFERRITAINKSLRSAPFAIIDHRIPANALPFLDFRGASGGKAVKDDDTAASDQD